MIALTNKPGATEYELYRTISLLSHITKLITENKEDLQPLLDIVEEENSIKSMTLIRFQIYNNTDEKKQSLQGMNYTELSGLKLNSKKTEVKVVSRNNECPQINIFVNRNEPKQRDQFKYLLTLISSDGMYNTEIAS